MNNNKKLIIIIVLIIMLLLIALLLFVLLGKNKKINNNEIIAEEIPVDNYKAYQVQRASEGATANDAVASLEDDINEYFTVEGIIKNFSTYILYLNGSAKDLNLIVNKDNEATVLQEYRTKGYECINNVLAQNYKTKYSVNNDYIYNLLKNYSGKNYTITDMYVVDDSAYINTYYVYGNYEGAEFNYIVILDKYNYTYEIYLNNYFRENGYSKDNLETMKTLNIECIEKNDNNNFQYKNIEAESMARIYFDNYVNLMKNNPIVAYSLLDTEYKQKRFDSIDTFEVFVDNILDSNDYMNIQYYTLTNVGNYKELACQDNYGRNIVFKITGVMKYTVILDSYTVPVQAYENEYKNADDAKKAQLCLNRFFECLSNHDYEKAYSYLNDTYKENNFSTVYDFMEHVKYNWFEINTFTYTDIEKSGQNYILSGQLYDLKTEGSYDAEIIDQTFIIKLGTDIRNFELSFEI